MKTHLLRTSILAVLAAAAVHAQGQTLRVNVPFDFILRSQTLRTGQYTVDQGAISGAVIIKGVDHQGGAVAIGLALQSVAVQNEGKLVFHRYGNTYFLTEVWGPGNYGRQLPKTNREREMAAQLLIPHNTTLVAS